MRTLTSTSATGAPAYSETLACAPESARQARRLVTAALETWHLAPLTSGAELIVTEFVANAAAHTECRYVRVTVTRVGDAGVRVGVVDKERRKPERQTPAADDEHGRGLAIVAALADRWGVDELPWGKRVWAELGTTR